MTQPAVVRVGVPRPTLQRTSWPRDLLNSLFFILAALVLSELALPRSSIDGPSMEPTLFTGQHLLISRVAYLLGDPQRGDIAVFDPPNAAKEMLIKRVIGIPGDTVELRRLAADGQGISDSALYVNGELVDEPYFVNRPCIGSKCAGSWTLGPDEYLMMGDNRNQSNDSRNPSVGLIPRDHIVGKAIWRHWPLNVFGPVE